MTRRAFALVLAALVVSSLSLQAGSAPARATQRDGGRRRATSRPRSGFQVISDGGNAVDAAVATAFALAVTHPTAGNIGGGGFIVFRPGERASRRRSTSARWRRPARSPTMFLKDGKYDSQLHHNSHLAVGVPGTVAGLHLAWKEHGSKPWKRLVEPAVDAGARRLRGQRRPGALARAVLDPTSRSIRRRSRSSPRTACRTKPATSCKQPDLARTLERIAEQGPGRLLRGRDGRCCSRRR